MKEIPLGNGRYTQVDDEDYDRLINYPVNWQAHFRRYTWYAVGRKQRNFVETTIQMHRIILGVSGDECVDHIDGNGLNNTRANLRIATKGQNNCNMRKWKTNSKSKYKGLGFDGCKWTASISYKNKSIYIGRYATEEEAARAYDTKAIELFGEFARLNFPTTPLSREDV